MAQKNIAKSDAIMRGISDDLKLRLAGSATIDTVREARDAEGWMYLVLSDGGVETAGNPVILVGVRAKDAASKDILGGDLYAFAPHIAQVAYELDGTNPEPDAGDLMKVLAKVAQCGVKIQLKAIADATPVTIANADAAAVKAEYDNLYWPGSGV